MAIERWEKIINGLDDAIISTLTINELLVYFYRSGKAKEGKNLISLLKMIGNIKFVPVSEEIAEKSAGYRHGLGLHTVDSIILATFVVGNCQILLASDDELKIAEDQKLIEVEVLK